MANYNISINANIVIITTINKGKCETITEFTYKDKVELIKEIESFLQAMI